MKHPSPPQTRYARISLPLRRASDRKTITCAAGPRKRKLRDGRNVTEWLSASGQLHRDPRDGPALIVRYPTGRIMEECYCLHDRCHREDGPAVIEYAQDGSIRGEECWLHGLEIARRRYTSMT